MEQRRNFLFDNMKVILIYLVVVGHVFNNTQYPYVLTKSIYYFIYFFHMPAFIFISGYFSKNVEKCRDTAVVRYFVPYLILIIVSFIQVRFLINDPEVTTIFRFFVPISGCWFLLALFIWKLMLKDLCRIRYVLPLLFLFGLAAGFSHEFSKTLSLSRLAVFSLFFMLGYYAQEKHIKKIRSIPKIFFLIGIIFVFLISYYFAVTKLVPTDMFLCNTYYRDDFMIRDFLFRLLYYIIALFMSAAVINLTTEKEYWFSKIGKNTITIYMLHLLVVRFLDAFFEKYPVFEGKSAIFYLVFVLLLAALLTWICSRKIVGKLYEQLEKFINHLIFREI